jgi:II/X family phage/plasmid replication protein
MGDMFDWVTARVPLMNAGIVNGGRVITIDALGEVEYETDRRLMVEGSHSARVSVRGGGDELVVSGNPTKFLQGHNLFGPSDLAPLVYRMLTTVADNLGLVPSLSDLQAWRRGNIELSRLDVTRMIDCGDDETVKRVLAAVGQVGRKKFQKGSVFGADTVYIGRGSRRQMMKLYHKSDELRVPGHKLPDSLAPIWHHKLLDYAVGKLRVEIQIGSKWFNENAIARRAGIWNGDLAASVLDTQLAALEVSDTMRLPDDIARGLPPKLVLVYEAWRAGHDLRAMYSKSRFYHYRKQLLAYGIDISQVQLYAVETEARYLVGFPIRDLLQRPGAGVPDWAEGTALLAS